MRSLTSGLEGSPCYGRTGPRAGVISGWLELIMTIMMFVRVRSRSTAGEY